MLFIQEALFNYIRYESENISLSERIQSAPYYHQVLEKLGNCKGDCRSQRLAPCIARAPENGKCNMHTEILQNIRLEARMNMEAFYKYFPTINMISNFRQSHWDGKVSHYKAL